MANSAKGSGRGSGAMGKKNLSTFDIAEMLEVDPGSVANWIDQGVLKAHRTPGGHRRVVVGDLLQFLREHKMPIPAEIEPGGDGRPKILVVDDEPDAARVVAKAIRAEHPDYKVVEVNDGFRAGTLVVTLKPDVVILDLRMPGMDGFDICKAIKSDEVTKHAVVIAITAYPSEENHRRIQECGADMCLSKPLDLSRLVEHIETALAQRGRQ